MWQSNVVKSFTPYDRALLAQEAVLFTNYAGTGRRRVAAHVRELISLLADV